MSSLAASFNSELIKHNLGPLKRSAVTTVQINVGKLCNQACHHCHVEAGPKRTEIMTKLTADRILELLKRTNTIKTVDITGGAPELNPNFSNLVESIRRMNLHVIDRCNLTVLLEPGFEFLGEFFARNQVEIIASLPCYTANNVDQQRGRGVFAKSIQALQYLNSLGYGRSDRLLLNLVYNPLGPSLPPPQDQLEAAYKQHLRADFGIEFHHLFTLANMPIRRFSDQLVRIGKEAEYQNLLQSRFNPATVEHLMCRSLVSISWDGGIYDCDFNQMLEMPAPQRLSVWDIDDFSIAAFQPIATGPHCFGCTAGAGSSCGGTLLS